MLDKALQNAYVWYSGATNVTGIKLAEALGMKHGEKKPLLANTSLILGWGAKTKDKVLLEKMAVLNHPNDIRANRDKLEALTLLKKAKVPVAPFCFNVAEISKKNSEIMLPVIGRTRYHQGGKGFWDCPTMSHVANAVKEGAAYFQNLIEIKDEFRLHVVGDKVIYAVKKAKRTTEEMEEAYIKHEMDRQKQLAEKNKDKFDEATAQLVLRRQAKKFAQDGANMLIRSNRLGWKFVRVKTVSKDLEREAINAIKALNLQFGAVDCCVDVKGKQWIIEVNSGPGLEETSFDAWVAALRDLITNTLKPKTITQKIMDKLKPEDSTKKPAVATKHGLMQKASDGTKHKLANKLALAQEMVAAADEEEAAVLDKVFGRMFNKG